MASEKITPKGLQDSLIHECKVLQMLLNEVQVTSAQTCEMADPWTRRKRQSPLENRCAWDIGPPCFHNGGWKPAVVIS